jgi:tetratricopeptide (TPR) repeat protein
MHVEETAPDGGPSQTELRPAESPTGRAKPVSVRPYSNAYLSISAIGTFFAAYCYYLGFETAAAALALASFAVFPILAFSDRVTFDGKRLYRRGPVWFVAGVFGIERPRFKPRHVVLVETDSIRTWKRGRNVRYRYRTTIQTKGASVRIGTRRGYREMIARVLPLVPESALDVRSLELRDHLKNSTTAKERARSLRIPEPDVLEATEFLQRKRRVLNTHAIDVIGEREARQAEDLRSLANQLRISGRLVQALEAFRRALLLDPRSGRLIYEFARCLQSFAASERDAGLDRRARAMLRLAERRSPNDADLLSRLGETYFLTGDIRRAEAVLNRAIGKPSKQAFRASRVLGELALRDGKIARALMHFSNAAEAVLPHSIRSWARSEVDYLRHLNDHDDYMELEIGRINLLETFEGAQRTSLRIFGLGLLVIAFGFGVDDELILDIGWAVSAVSLLIWAVSALGRTAFTARIPFDLMDKS